MSDPLKSEPALPRDEETRAAFDRARESVAKALAHPQVVAAIRAQREAMEREREDRLRKRA